MDWTPYRFPNCEIGKDPANRMFNAFLDACDLWVFHRIAATLTVSGSIAVVSSWCRDRYTSKKARFNIATRALSVNVPITREYLQAATVHFSRVGQQSVRTSGNVSFKLSYAPLTKRTPMAKLSLNASSITSSHSSRLTRQYHRMGYRRCYVQAVWRNPTSLLPYLLYGSVMVASAMKPQIKCILSRPARTPSR